MFLELTKKILRLSVNCLPHGVRHRISHLPGIAAFQRWLVNRVLSGDPFVHTINAGPAAGLRFEVTLPLDKAIWAGTYERKFAAEIARRVSDFEIIWGQFWEDVQTRRFRPRDYILENLTLEKCAQDYIRIVHQVMGASDS